MKIFVFYVLDVGQNQLFNPVNNVPFFKEAKKKRNWISMDMSRAQKFW